MNTRGIQMSRRFALLASLALVGGLIPGYGIRPVAAAQIAAAPEAPDTLEAFPADREPIKIGLIWDDNSGNETGFEVERRIYKSENEFEKIGGTGANQTQFVDGAIRNNIQYEYRVRAVNGDGASGYTNSAIAFFGSPGKFSVGPTKIDFGNVRIGAVRNRGFTIRNTGRSNVTLNVAMVDEGGPFSISAGGGEIELEQGKSTRVTVQYAPTQTGRDSAQVKVTMDDLELRVRLRGQAGNNGGGTKIRVSPIPVDFGNVRVGATRTRQFTVRNTGQEPASVTISQSSGKAFNFESGGGDVEIAPGSSHRVTVTFSPDSAGRATGLAIVTLDKSQVQVPLKGKGVKRR